MISSISSGRVWPQQVVFKAFNDTSGNPDNPTPGSSNASLSRLFYSEAADEDEGYGYESELSSQFGSMQRTATGNGMDPGTDGAIDDISSNAFMKALQQKIDTLKASADTSAMAGTMQAALAAGRLTVTDAAAGEQIAARSVANANAASHELTKVSTSEWSSFLRDSLLRDSDGSYVRNGDSSHIDKTTGASAYFGMIGEAHYYLSWTAAANS